MAKKHSGSKSSNHTHHTASSMPPTGDTYGHPRHGAAGSHQNTHKEIGGARSTIHQGMPHELESFHGKDKGTHE